MKPINICPNCGGHIEGNKCPYCDTVFNLPPNIEEKFSEQMKESIFYYISNNRETHIKDIKEVFHISLFMAVKYISKLLDEERIIKVIRLSDTTVPPTVNSVFYKAYIPKHKWSKYKREIKI